MTVPPALKLVLTFLCPWQQCLASPLNISPTCTEELLSFLSLLLFSSLNPLFKKKKKDTPPFPPTWHQIHAKTVEQRRLQGCCLDTFIWYLRDHGAEIKCCQHVTVPQHVSRNNRSENLCCRVSEGTIKTFNAGTDWYRNTFTQLDMCVGEKKVSCICTCNHKHARKSHKYKT